MNQSENISELVGALSKAQGKMRPAIHNKINPHFKNHYADLASCMEACRLPLSENGLSVMQFVEQKEGNYFLVTMLAHVSGQFIKSFLPLQMKNPTCQALGSELTYLKRYGISAMLGIVADADVADDDDGNRASETPKKISELPKKEIRTITQEQIKDINDFLTRKSPDFIERFKRFLSTKYNIQFVKDIPESEFDFIKRTLEASDANT